MTQEDKELLLKDLSVRLPYGVKLQKFNEPDSAFELYSLNKESGEIMFYKYRGKALEIADVGRLYRRNILLYKPFLRPMSSMTEEERDEVEEISHGWFYINEDGEIFPMGRLTDSGEFEDAILPTFEYFLKHHFDYRGLIEKGLALEAPEGMYNY